MHTKRNRENEREKEEDGGRGGQYDGKQWNNSRKDVRKYTDRSWRLNCQRDKTNQQMGIDWKRVWNRDSVIDIENGYEREKKIEGIKQ